jgi:hypothetical protein
MNIRFATISAGIFLGASVAVLPVEAATVTLATELLDFSDNEVGNLKFSYDESLSFVGIDIDPGGSFPGKGFDVIAVNITIEQAVLSEFLPSLTSDLELDLGDAVDKPVYPAVGSLTTINPLETFFPIELVSGNAFLITWTFQINDDLQLFFNTANWGISGLVEQEDGSFVNVFEPLGTVGPVEVVPTPNLAIGLVATGIAAWKRKKKQIDMD